MSAFVVEKIHVAAMVELACSKRISYRIGSDWKTADYRDADAIGQMLMDECVRSVSTRYPDDEITNLPGRMDAEWLIPYVQTDAWRGELPTAVEGLKIVNCYVYQTCGTDDYETTDAIRFAESLKTHLISSLPGYDEAPWEWKARGNTQVSIMSMIRANK